MILGQGLVKGEASRAGGEMRCLDVWWVPGRGHGATLLWNREQKPR